MEAGAEGSQAGQAGPPRLITDVAVPVSAQAAAVAWRSVKTRAEVDELRIVAQHRPLGAHVLEIVRYRELLARLIGRELKVRYKNSTLGFVWSMVQPLFLLAVYAAVFSILGASFSDFALWILCGLLIWNMVSTAVLTATSSITSNAYLVGKVRFPRAVLPLSMVGAALVHFFLQMLVFVVLIVATRHQVDWTFMWLVPLALLVSVVVASAFALLLSTANVFSRDTQHLLELSLLAWFWLTPVIYQYDRLALWLSDHGVPAGIFLINPLTSVVIVFQRAFYGRASVPTDDNSGQIINLLPSDGPMWYLRNLAITGGVGLTLFVLALVMFDRAESRFAEAL